MVGIAAENHRHVGKMLIVQYNIINGPKVKISSRSLYLPECLRRAKCCHRVDTFPSVVTKILPMFPPWCGIRNSRRGRGNNAPVSGEATSLSAKANGQSVKCCEAGRLFLSHPSSSPGPEFFLYRDNDFEDR
jgi:hypothetical protein